MIAISRKVCKARPQTDRSSRMLAPSRLGETFAGAAAPMRRGAPAPLWRRRRVPDERPYDSLTTLVPKHRLIPQTIDKSEVCLAASAIPLKRIEGKYEILEKIREGGM